MGSALLRFLFHYRNIGEILRAVSMYDQHWEKWPVKKSVILDSRNYRIGSWEALHNDAFLRKAMYKEWSQKKTIKLVDIAKRANKARF